MHQEEKFERNMHQFIPKFRSKIQEYFIKVHKCDWLQCGLGEQ